MSGIEGVGGISPGAVPGGGQGQDGTPLQRFAQSLDRGIEQVSDADREADAVATELATGGDAEVHELMAATNQASLSVELMTQVRDRAVESYQEIMRMQL